MGPPLFSDGNLPKESMKSSSGPRFNGATAFQRWKHGTPMVLSAQRTGFNGATAFQRWKRPPKAAGALLSTVASMGPPLFSDGNQPILPSPEQRMGASMGPPLFSDGNTGLVWPIRHDLLASMGPPLFSDGNLCGPGRAGGAAQASMGPPLFSDGNNGNATNGSHGRPSFNGATAFQRWKPGPADQGRGHC